MAKKALSKVRKLERKQEVKSFDITLTTIVDVSTVGDVRNLALITQGDARVERDGNSIAPFFLKIRYHWFGVAADTFGVFRTIIFRDKRQIDTTVPAVLDVLTQGHPLSQTNYTHRNRFKILFDQTFTNANDAAIIQNYSGVINIKLNLKMAWSGAATTAINQNGLYMINITNLAAAQPDFLFTSRLFFNDN